jgi:hypothetical protein
VEDAVDKPNLVSNGAGEDVADKSKLPDHGEQSHIKFIWALSTCLY